MLTSPPDLFRKAQQLKDDGADFVIATVVQVRGSASAKTGSKALFDQHGVNLYGYVGGGCAESHVAQEACEALRERSPRIVEIDLDDEVFGLMPCGGVMDVYLEPHFSSSVLELDDLGAWNAAAEQLLKELGFQSRFKPELPLALHSWRELFLHLAGVLAQSKGYPLLPLRDSKGHGPLPIAVLPDKPEHMIVFGQTRICEEFCRLLQIFEWPVQVYLPTAHLHSYSDQVQVCQLPIDCENLAIPAGAWVLIASHHKQDAAIAQRALQAGAAYVALVASEKRSGLIAADMQQQGLPGLQLQRLFMPAGLNMPTDTPLQMAFSILCEILQSQTAQ